MQAKSRYVVVNNPKLAVAAQGVRRRRPRHAGRRPPVSSPSSTATASTRASATPSRTTPAGALPNTTPESGRDADSHQSQDPRALDQHPRAQRERRRGRARRPRRFTTVFVKTADGCATTYPSQNIVTNTTTAAVWPRCPSRASRTGATSSALSARSQGSPRTATPTSGRGPASAPTTRRQTSTAVAETAANRVDDTIVNTNANGVPALSANPIYPATPVLPATNGSIIIRLNRTGPCE